MYYEEYKKHIHNKEYELGLFYLFLCYKNNPIKYKNIYYNERIKYRLYYNIKYPLLYIIKHNIHLQHVLDELIVHEKKKTTPTVQYFKNTILKKNKQLILYKKPSFLLYSPTDIFTDYKTIHDFNKK